MLRRQGGRLAALVLGLALVGGTLGASSARAVDDRSLPPGPAADSLKALRAELAESSEAMLAAATQLRLAETALPGSRAAVVRAHARLEQARQLLALANRKRAESQTRLMIATRDNETLGQVVDLQRASVGRLARAAYQGGGPLSTVSMMLEARSFTDLTHAVAAWEHITMSQRGTLTQLQATEDTYGLRTTGLERLRDEFAAGVESAERQVAEVAELEAAALAAEAEVVRLVDARRGALDAARAAEAADQAQLAAMQGESSRLQSQLRALTDASLGAGSGGASVVPVPRTLSAPVRGRITSPFGMRTHPITGVHKLHTGTDFGASCGTPIRAARDGTVLSAALNSAYGWRTVVSHGVVGGVLLTTTYNHQQGPGVVAGAQVRTGQVIGRVGSTGYSTGCHLHLELVVNSDFVDPVPWLGA